VGSPAPAADAEMIAMASEALRAVGIPAEGFVFKINTRRLLNGVLNSAGVPAVAIETRLAVLRALDKLDRLGQRGVEQLLGPGRKDESGDFTQGAKLDPAQIAKVMALVTIETGRRGDALAALEPLTSGDDEARAGFAELAEIDRVLTACKVGDAGARIEPSVVRGLEYYTGAVFEAELLMTGTDGQTTSFGSVGGGGRYDDLIARFRGENVPATGFSIGVSRLVAALAGLQRHVGREATGPVVVLVLDRAHIDEAFATAAELRHAGYPAEVYMGSSGMGAQMKYADRRGSPAVVMVGENERAAGAVTVKDLRLGANFAAEIEDHARWRADNPAQQTIPRSDLVAAIAGIHQRQSVQ